MRGEEWRLHTSGCTLHLGCQITHTYPIGIRDENHRRSKDQQNVLLLQGPLFARHLENLTQVSPIIFSFLFFFKIFFFTCKKGNYCTTLNTRKKRYFELNMKWFLINIFDKVCICSCTDSPPVQIWKHTMQCYSPCYWFVECVGFRSFNYSFLQLKYKCTNIFFYLSENSTLLRRAEGGELRMCVYIYI